MQLKQLQFMFEAFLKNDDSGPLSANTQSFQRAKVITAAMT